MKKILVSALFLVVAMSAVGFADTTTTSWDVSGAWTLNFDFGSPYVHQMYITGFDSTTGAFSGNGFYVADPSYTWTVTGFVTGNTVNFDMLYTGTGAGYTVHVLGTISADGCSITGSGGTSSGQEFTLVATGYAHPVIGSLGFDHGYNLKARIFIGTGWNWCMDKVGDPVWCSSYLGASANDKVVMKWNAAWSTCNAGGSCVGAWEDNEWNGNVPYGSGVVWHYKIKWIGTCIEGATLSDGGYCLWGAYEVLMDQGVDPAVGHTWIAHATPNGYGV
jgi:hypothetical protein